MWRIRLLGAFLIAFTFDVASWIVRAWRALRGDWRRKGPARVEPCACGHSPQLHVEWGCAGFCGVVDGDVLLCQCQNKFAGEKIVKAGR